MPKKGRKLYTVSNATMKRPHKRIVMVFGVFDRLHPGHRAFLREAKSYGKGLIVVVARDSAVWKLKKKNPHENEKKRLAALQKIKGVSDAVIGDQKQGSYGVIKKYRPDIICLGYDQHWLEKDLRKKIVKKSLPTVKLIQLTAHRPNRFHTSLLK